MADVPPVHDVRGAPALSQRMFAIANTVSQPRRMARVWEEEEGPASRLGPRGDIGRTDADRDSDTSVTAARLYRGGEGNK